MMLEILYIVIPCFNERAVLPETAEILRTKLDRLKENGVIAPDSRVLFVNNHSEDGTFDFIAESARKHPDSFTGISLSTNCGQQNALFAWLETAVEYADIIITMDADLQDDPNVIDEMLKKKTPKARRSFTGSGTTGKATRFSKERRPACITVLPECWE